MGGGHAISKCGIKLNDVKALCGLKDGQVYDFDFYYMERHGTAANFGIETNIKIVAPSMLSEKSVDSGTEQYYEIDIDNLVYDESNNRYLLLVGTNDSEHSYNALALTNLKVSGYTIGFAEQETKAAAAANAIENSPALSAFKALRDHYKALAPDEPIDEEPIEEPAINENLLIASAVLRANKIVSGKNATLTAKVSGDAASVEVSDADGNAVEFKKCVSSEKNGLVTFQAVWSVTGSRGDVLSFTVVAYDSDGLRSFNTVPITVTIK